MSKTRYDDPVYRNTYREAFGILTLWGLCFAWVISYCSAFGYRSDGPESLRVVFGMPSWVFWGVAVPWLAASVAGLAMSLWWIHEDDLGEVDEHLEDVTAATSDSSAPNGR